MKLYVVEVPGGKTRAVVDVLNFTDVHACWSPDGRRIAYSATLLDANGERDGETSLFVIDADGNNTTTVRTEKHEPNCIRLRRRAGAERFLAPRLAASFCEHGSPYALANARGY